MKSSTWLRIASLTSLLQYTGHSYLFLTASPAHGQNEIDLITAMNSNHWNFSGFERSYWDFYFGYGLIAIIWGFFQTVLLWQVASISRSQASTVRPLFFLLLFVNVFHGVIAFRYFFLLPVIFDSTVAILLGLALMKQQSGNESN